MSKQTAALLNAQSVHLDVLDVSIRCRGESTSQCATGTCHSTARMATRRCVVLLSAIASATITRSKLVANIESYLCGSEPRGEVDCLLPYPLLTLTFRTDVRAVSGPDQPDPTCHCVRS